MYNRYWQSMKTGLCVDVKIELIFPREIQKIIKWQNRNLENIQGMHEKLLDKRYIYRCDNVNLKTLNFVLKNASGVK